MVECPLEVYSVGVASGHERRSRRRADRLRDIEISEAHTFATQPVDVRRANALCAKGADVPIAHVVGEDEHNVGLASRLGGGACWKAAEHEKHTRERHEIFTPHETLHSMTIIYSQRKDAKTRVGLQGRDAVCQASRPGAARDHNVKTLVV